MAGPGRQGRSGFQGAAIRLGSVRGIRIEANWSVAFIFVLIAFGLATLQFPSVNQHQSALTYAVAAILTAVVFFASLLAHELAHSLVAQRYGLRVEKITLWIFGGVSQLSGDVPSPGAEVWIAGVGPLTSLVLGAIFLGAAAPGHPVLVMCCRTGVRNLYLDGGPRPTVPGTTLKECQNGTSPPEGDGYG